MLKKTREKIHRNLLIIAADMTSTLAVDKLTIGSAERLLENVKTAVAENQLSGLVDHRGDVIVHSTH